MEVADARLGSRQTCAPPWMRLETFATRAIAAASASCACTPHFALLAPEHDPAGRWSDTLFAEGKLPYELPARLDAELRANPHYAHCRTLANSVP